MPSKDPEDNNGHTDTEEETIALRKKRRVSFAETTAVRFFERDDECETPRKQSSSAEGSDLRRTVSEEFRELLRTEGCGGDENEDGDDDEDVAAKIPFFRPIESPSSGSGFGSATSNDEDNFFGPVSADFIKPGCLSDSAASEENHDVTMDSTAFSMHFRSLARSESGGDIKSPRDLGGKTPTQATPTNPGNVMVLTKPRTMIHQSPFSFKTNSEGTDSSDMSLVGESLQRYDYGCLSTELDALLADENNELGAVSASDQIGGSSSTTHLEGGKEHPTSIRCHGSPNVVDTDHMTGKPPLSTDLVSSPHASIDEAVGSFKFSEAGQRAQDTSFRHDPLASQNCTDDQNITPFQKKGDPFLGYREFVRGASEQTSKQRTELLPGSAPPKLSVEQVGSLLTGSISSIEHKKMKIFTNVINSSVKQRDSAQFKEVIGSSHTKENGNYIQSLPSFGKSASRFQRLETVPLSLSLKDKDRIKSSQLVLSAYHLMTPINTNAVAPNNNLDKMRQMNLPVVRLEEQFSTDIKHSEGPRGMGKTPSDEFLPSEQVVNIPKVQEAPYNPSASLLVDNSEEHLDNEASLSHFHSSGAKEPGNLILTENEGHKNITTMGSDSSLFNSTLNDRNYRKETSSIGGLTVMSQSLEFQTSPLGNLKPYKLNLDMGSHSRGRIDGTSNSVSQTDNGGILVDQRAGATTTSFELDWSGYIDGENNLLRDGTMLTNFPSHTESSGSLQTYSRNEGSNSYSILNNAVKARSNPFISVEQFSQDQLFQETQVDLCHQPSAQQPCTAADKVLPLETTDVPALKVDICCEESPKSLKKSNHANSVGVKQKSEELIGGIEKAFNSSITVQKLLKDQICVAVSQNVSHQRGDKLVQKIGCDKRMKLGHDVFYRFKNNAQSLFSRSVAKLDTQVIMKLEDVVSCLQKAKAFQVFSEMWCQRVSEGVSYSHVKKVADIKLLLYSTLYEKVKLRLVHEKLDILQGKTQLLHSAMKECQELKSKFCCNLFPGQRNHSCDTDDPNHGLRGCDSDSEQEKLERIRTLRDSLEDLAKKIEKLTKTFQFSFKMKKELNCKETVEYVKAHLKRKAPCLSLQQELQLWEVDSVDSGTGYFTVALKYDGFFCQRFKFNKCNSRIAIQSELNNVKILKTWPNIDACTAVEYVLTGETKLKYTGPSIFVQETQRMSLLFCNLHDVLEEVKQARIEMMNLVESKFSLPSATKLDLGLTFMDYGVNRKVMLKLDLSCLNCGIYPSEIMPYHIIEVGGRVSEKRKAISPPTVADIKSAVGCLGCGYLRILRLCRCVSNMLSK